MLEAQAAAQKLAVQYGDRQRIIDLTDPQLSTYFRAPEPCLYAVGDVIEYNSASLGGWLRGTGEKTPRKTCARSAWILNSWVWGFCTAVEDVGGGKLAIQYASRQRIVDLADPKLPEYFRPTYVHQPPPPPPPPPSPCPQSLFIPPGFTCHIHGASKRDMLIYTRTLQVPVHRRR
eukprot:COSAG05_NODE_1064_length_5991_cov_12.180414_9_plen_175_part_00